VQFEVDGASIATVSSSPYTTTWNSTGVSNGSHTLYAVAEDTSGNYATSSESVSVENAPIIFSISPGPPTNPPPRPSPTAPRPATAPRHRQ
jgi:hypothetical protein